MKLDKLFSILLAFYPVLCLYAAFSSFTIGDVFLIILLIMYFLNGGRIKINAPLLPIFVCYIILVLLLRVAFSTDNDTVIQGNAALIRGLKLLFYTIGVISVGTSLLNFKVFAKYTIWIGTAASCFMIFQYICFLALGIVVLGQIPGLALHLTEYTEIDYETFYSNTFRPCSIFLEPAMYVQYMMIPLSIVLFTKTIFSVKIKFFLALLFTTTCFMSTSGQGILYITLLYSIYAFNTFKNKFVLVIILIVFFIIALISYNIVEPFQFAVDRLLKGEDAQDARLGTYHYCYEMTGWRMIFGNGYGIIPNNEYLAGAAYVWYGGGIIGLFLVLLTYMNYYVKSKPLFSRFVCFIFFVMLWGTAIFYNYMLFWFFSIISGTMKSDFELNSEIFFKEGKI